MTSYLEMSMEEWEKTFKPINNHLDDNASFQNENDEGIMFETYGDEIEFVKSQPVNRIWTYHHGDENSSYISNGMGVINRLGYFITELPCPENTDVFVIVEEPNYLCENCEEQWFGAAADLHYAEFSDLAKCAACATMEELNSLDLNEEERETIQ
jgi:hypothetical protein